MTAPWSELVAELSQVTYQQGVITAGSPHHRIAFQDGLTDVEVKNVEDKFNIRFPPDLRAFLQTALPSGPGFPNWRAADEGILIPWLNCSRDDFLDDDELWLDEWGARPSCPSDALKFANEQVTSAPQLIPVYLHRMIPSEPHLEGNPVFSIYGQDIIYYGVTLFHYFASEFGLTGLKLPDAELRHIAFWGSVVA